MVRLPIILKNGQSTSELDREETNKPFSYIGIIDRNLDQGLSIPGNIPWTLCPSDNESTYCNGVNNESINAGAIHIPDLIFGDGFETN